MKFTYKGSTYYSDYLPELNYEDIEGVEFQMDTNIYKALHFLAENNIPFSVENFQIQILMDMEYYVIKDEFFQTSFDIERYENHNRTLDKVYNFFRENGIQIVKETKNFNYQGGKANNNLFSNRYYIEWEL